MVTIKILEDKFTGLHNFKKGSQNTVPPEVAIEAVQGGYAEFVGDAPEIPEAEDVETPEDAPAAETPEDREVVNYRSMNKKQLLTECSDRGIDATAKDTVDELIEKLEA